MRPACLLLIAALAAACAPAQRHTVHHVHQVVVVDRTEATPRITRVSQQRQARPIPRPAPRFQPRAPVPWQTTVHIVVHSDERPFVAPKKPRRAHPLASLRVVEERRGERRRKTDASSQRKTKREQLRAPAATANRSLRDEKKKTKRKERCRHERCVALRATQR